jgi:hypothetical protein
MEYGNRDWGLGIRDLGEGRLKYGQHLGWRGLGMPFG